MRWEMGCAGACSLDSAELQPSIYSNNILYSSDPLSKQTTTGNFFLPSLFLLNWCINWRPVPYLSYSIQSSLVSSWLSGSKGSEVLRVACPQFPGSVPVAGLSPLLADAEHMA